MKICILGRHGFIGKKLEAHLKELGYEITSNPTKEVKAIIHLASPTHIDFEKNPEYHMGEAIASFQTLLPFCKQNNIYFMYASSALVYEPEKKTPFRNCKLIMEQLATASGARTCGLRIFPVYGLGEYRTVISQWCNQMKRGTIPTVYGDASQSRDFIHVSDVVKNMAFILEKELEGFIDIGAGKPVCFGDILREINNQLGTEIVPNFVDKPEGYSQGISCQNPVKVSVSIGEGIKEFLNGRPI